MRRSCCIKMADFPMKCEEMRFESPRYSICHHSRRPHYHISASAKAGVDFKMSGDLVKTVYPSIRVLPYDSELYSSIHTDFLDVYADCSPAVEPVKEGEVFIDLTGVRDDPPRSRAHRQGAHEISSAWHLMAICSSTKISLA